MSTLDALKRAQDTIPRFLQEFAKEFLLRLNLRTPVDTGALRAANKVEVVGNTIVVSNAMIYFDFIEDGTYKIRPVGMLKTTAVELGDIARVAMQRAMK